MIGFKFPVERAGFAVERDDVAAAHAHEYAVFRHRDPGDDAIGRFQGQRADELFDLALVDPLHLAVVVDGMHAALVVADVHHAVNLDRYGGKGRVAVVFRRVIPDARAGGRIDGRDALAV